MTEEISYSNTTKLINKKVTVIIDRQMGSKHPKWGFIYPVNYGYIKNIMAPDEEELDAYVLGVFEPVAKFEGICIAIIKRSDDNDNKMVVVPEGKEYSDEAILALTEFQERFFKPKVVRY